MPLRRVHFAPPRLAKLGLQSTSWHVRLWPLADITIALPNVRFGGKADIAILERHVCF
jgi:hypothetical protein